MSETKYLFDDMEEGSFSEVLNIDDIDILYPAISQLIKYLWEVADDKARPKRTDLNPADIQQLLPFMSIMDTILEGDKLKDLSVRLMGTELVNNYGEVTGTLISNYPDEVIKNRILSSYSLACESRQIVVTGVSSFSEDKTFVKIKTAAIPLFDDENDRDKVTKILGMVCFNK